MGNHDEKYTLIENQFLVCPRDFLVKKIVLTPKTIIALNNAARILRANSKGRYRLVLTRGYIYWGKWRRFREQIAKLFFCFSYWSDRAVAKSLFGHNGHNDGCSVDVLLYDVSLGKKIQWLPWKNIIISRMHAEKIIEMNKSEISMLDIAMNCANFTAHSDPREKLQMHYRLNDRDENISLITIPNSVF